MKKGKLVRDKIPQIIKLEGIKPNTRILNNKEYGESLVDKLHEEAKEISLAIKNKTNPVEELADILELINAAAVYVGSSFKKVELERLKKLKKRGGFKKKIMLVSTDNKNQ